LIVAACAGPGLAGSVQGRSDFQEQGDSQSRFSTRSIERGELEDFLATHSTPRIDGRAVLVRSLATLPQTGPIPITENAVPVAQPLPLPPTMQRTLGRLGASEWLALGTLISAPFVLVILWMRDVIRPGSFARNGVREVGSHPAWAWFLAAFLMFAAQALGGSLGLSMFASGGPVATISTLPLRVQALVNLSGYVPALAAGVLLVGLLRDRSSAASGLRLSWRDAGWGLLSFLAAYPLVTVVSQGATVVYARINGAPPDSMAHSGLQTMIQNSSDPWSWALMACAVVGAPIVEELVFRVFLQSAALRLTKSSWLAVGLTSVAFTSIHWSVMPWYGLVTIFALSVGMGLAYERTKRLGVPIVMHVAFNALNVALALVTNP